jgi:hypothetical protein
MTRGNLGVAGKVELAEMAALPPFAQMIADMSGLSSGGACGSGVCVHAKTYHANFTASITSDVIDLRVAPDQSHSTGDLRPSCMKGELP